MKNHKAYTVISYILKAEGKEHNMASVYFTLEAGLNMAKLSRNNRIIGLNSYEFNTYEEAVAARNKLRKLDLS